MPYASVNERMFAIYGDAAVFVIEYTAFELLSNNERSVIKEYKQFMTGMVHSIEFIDKVIKRSLFL